MLGEVLGISTASTTVSAKDATRTSSCKDMLLRLGAELDALHNENLALAAEAARLEEEVCALRKEAAAPNPADSPPGAAMANGSAESAFKPAAEQHAAPSRVTLPGEGESAFEPAAEQHAAPSSVFAAKAKESTENTLNPAAEQPAAPSSAVAVQPVKPGQIKRSQTSMQKVAKVLTKEQEEFLARLQQRRAGNFDPAPPQPLSVLARLQNALESPAVEFFVALLIISNTIFMAFEMQYIGDQAGYEMGFAGYNRPADEKWPGADTFFRVSENVLSIIFIVELTLRLLVFRWRMFTNLLRLLDVFVVSVSIVSWLGPRDQMLNPMAARTLRLMKLTRALRIARLERVTDSLHLLLRCISASVATLSWSVAVLFLVQCIAAMVLSQLVFEFLTDDTKSTEARQDVFRYYGTFSRTMITMFEIHLANWSPACRVLVDNIGESIGYFFICYRCLAGFCVLNVINAVFINQTLKVAQRDQDLRVHQRQKETAMYCKELKHLFEALDTSRDGKLTWAEIQHVIDDPQIKLWMSCLDIDPHDMEVLFLTMDVNHDNVVTVDELLSSASRVKGVAQSIDMVRAIASIRSVDDKLANYMCTTHPGAQVCHMTETSPRVERTRLKV